MPKVARADRKVAGLEGNRPLDSFAAGVIILESLNLESKSRCPARNHAAPVRTSSSPQDRT